MRKIYFLLASLLINILAQAQTTPSVNFNFSVSISLGNVSFTNTSQNLGEGIKKAFWSFGDGSSIMTGPFESVVHHYASASTYQACLKIYRYSSNSNDSTLIGSECKAVTLTAPTIADSCYANYTIQPVSATPLGRKFIAQPWHNKQKKPVRICWKFGDGKDTCIEYTTAYSGDYWVEHSYANYGQYEACVTINYDGGCESKRCNTVTINTVVPTVECEAGINEAATNISNLERRFYVGLQSNKTAEKICWNFGDGSDTCILLSYPLNPQQLMVVHHYVSPGNYTVCVKVNYAGGCVAQRCKPVEIRMQQGNICGGYFTDSVVSANTIRFRGTGIQSPNDYVINYTWTFGDGTLGSGQQMNHTYAPGKYSVCLVIRTNTGCETRICKQIEIAGNVHPQLMLTPNPVVSTLTAVFQSLLQQPVSVKIYNSNGIMIRSFTRSAVVGTNTWTFDLGGLQTGVYSMIVQSPNQFATAIFFKR